MRVIRLTRILLAFMALLYGCIYPYDIDVTGNKDALIIHGRVTGIEGYQYVNISRSISLSNLDETFPVSKCSVSIQDDLGNDFPAMEKEPGIYAIWISSEYLLAGTRFKLVISTPDGKRYASDYDELLACPPIDSISWEIEEMLTQDPNITYEGVRFYVNTDCSGEFAKNYHWEMEETWEYHSTYKALYYYDGQFRMLNYFPDSLYYCWRSADISEIYTYSTQNLTRGVVRKFPLNYVSNQTDKLGVKYSLMVRQFSLTRTAYDYWRILEDQSKQTGELYETQPASLNGNIYSLDDSREPVIGLFHASMVQEKRIFITPGISVVRPSCYPMDLTQGELMEELSYFSPLDYPVWLLEKEGGGYDLADQSCFDCMKRGGTPVKPEFW